MAVSRNRLTIRSETKARLLLLQPEKTIPFWHFKKDDQRSSPLEIYIHVSKKNRLSSKDRPSLSPFKARVQIS